MALAQDFQAVVDSLPDDWTDLELDLRIADESRYVDAAVMLSQVNAQPYSRAEWHWRINVAHRFGHAAAPRRCVACLAKLDREGIAGELRVRDAQEGRAEVVQMWGRPESVRRDFRRGGASLLASRILRRSESLALGDPEEATGSPTPAGWRRCGARLISVRVQGRSSSLIASTIPRLSPRWTTGTISRDR